MAATLYNDVVKHLDASELLEAHNSIVQLENVSNTKTLIAFSSLQ